MNIYSDDTIFLSKEATRDFLSSLLNDKESVSLRDEFLSGMEKRITFSDDGSSIEVEIPDLDFVDIEYNELLKTYVRTQNIEIQFESSDVLGKFYECDSMQSYTRVSTDKSSRYVWNREEKIQWNKSEQLLRDAA